MRRSHTGAGVEIMWLFNKRTSTDIQLKEQLRARVAAETLNHARTIGLSLLPTLKERPAYMLGITSALPGEGKSTLSHALAEVMGSDFARKVMLLDLHAEHPSVAAGDDTRSSRLGLSDWARTECSLEEVQITHEAWTALPCGTQISSSRDLLHVLTRGVALSQLRERFDLIVLDLPSLSNPAGAALASQCDGVVYVVRAGSTPVASAKNALPLLQHVTVHGAVLNRYRPATPRLLRKLTA
jgi:Mrp family chromosome partitioning ATPase